MSEPAVFVVIREGHKRVFYDSWAHVFLYRHLLWGDEALDEWLSAEEPDEDGFEHDCCGGLVVDFDQKRLTWNGDDHELEIPRVASVLDRLLETAWPGYQIQYASGSIDELAVAAGESEVDGERNSMIDGMPIELLDRPQTVRHAAGFDDDPDFEDEDEEEDEESDLTERDVCAWVTLVDPEGRVRHRQFDEIPVDLIKRSAESLPDLLGLPAAEVPAEAGVREGIWFDSPTRTIGIWGRAAAKPLLPHVQQHWKGWNVTWSSNGYSDHCAVSGPSGIPMSDAEALARLTPKILSTKRVDLSNLLGAFGGALKSTALKATGCLAIVLSLPVLLFGLIAGKMSAALITIVIVWVLIAIACKVLESKFKRKFNGGLMGDMAQRETEGDSRPPVAGPIDPQARRATFEQLLAASGLPSLDEIDKHVDEDEALSSLL